MVKFNRRRSTFMFIFLAFYLVALGVIIRDRYLQFTNDTNIQDIPITTHHDQVNITPTVREDALPDSKLLAVPFTSQAPLKVWDAFHEESCEEASLMMVNYFQGDKTFSSSQTVEDELQALVGWETANNYKVDVTVSELSQIAAKYYKMTTGRIIVNPTVKQIKKEIANGRPVIVPAAGRILPNPNFTAPGPNYHMLVIKGYNASQFITNDPGTRKGESFVYSYADLINAIHDWDPGNILNGRKAVLVFD